jgi:FtsP/CotA-like multicopper oxidase with cupredoxin domain
MTGRPVPEGALFYGETKRRVVVPFDVASRKLTEKTAAAFGALVADARHTDPVIVGKFVYHCHAVDHEDKGMMGAIEVTA